MKKSKQCPKCESLKIGFLETVPDQVSDPDDSGQRWEEADQAIGAVRVGEATWTGGPPRRIYKVEGYLCTECGYFETYVKNPQSVAFDRLDGFHWLNPETPEAGPFR